MINFIISAIIWYYTARAAAYAVYTFKDRNIAGGVSVMLLAALTFSASIIYMIDIFK